MAAQELGQMPTTEGALDMKLGLAQVLNGFAGNEALLRCVSLYRDRGTHGALADELRPRC
jgi:hypothetical protein